MKAALAMYCYAKLSAIDFVIIRVLGPGLGNLLFPWARSIVAARKHDMIPLWPTWPQFKLGPLLRKEQDKRLYHDLFSRPDDYVSGLRKLWLLSRAPKIAERIFTECAGNYPQRAVVVFEGMENYFEEILKDHGLVRAELLRIACDDHKRGLTVDFSRSISVHVRLGDFVATSATEDINIASGHVNFRLPLSWYVAVVEEIRRSVGEAWQVYIFSDGTDLELEPLLRLPRCIRASFGSSLADLLALSQAHVLVASGSTFSMWASYLGRMPVIWHHSQIRQGLYYERTGAEIELAEGERLPTEFIAELRRNSGKEPALPEKPTVEMG